jgi:hypothetical protein
LRCGQPGECWHLPPAVGDAILDFLGREAFLYINQSWISGRLSFPLLAMTAGAFALIQTSAGRWAVGSRFRGFGVCVDLRFVVAAHKLDEAPQILALQIGEGGHSTFA